MQWRPKSNRGDIVVGDARRRNSCSYDHVQAEPSRGVRVLRVHDSKPAQENRKPAAAVVAAERLRTLCQDFSQPHSSSWRDMYLHAMGP